MMLGHVLENSFVIRGFALLVLTVKIRENATKMRYVGRECVEGKETVQNILAQDLT